MRRGDRNGWIQVAGEVIGVNLGADFCAEHEWGIRGLKDQFGVPSESEIANGHIAGIEARKVTEFPETLRLWKSKKHNVLISGYNLRDEPANAKQWADIIGFYELYLPIFKEEPRGNLGLVVAGGDLGSAWDEKSFAAHTENHADDLAMLHAAFKEMDVILTFGACLPIFENPGLCLIVASKLPKEAASYMREADLDRFELRAVAAKTGIEERLGAAKRRFFALSPRWKDKAKNEVVFWLNPYDQDRFNYGSFTVAQLDEWIAGKGPIMKKMG